jgi:anti-sigma regulatory factor (Ser/Thr protein kinase)
VTYAQTWDLDYGTDELGVPPCDAPPFEPVSVSDRNLSQIFLSVAPEAARAARAFTKTTLIDWQLGDLITEAVLIASELVTNAVRHGGCCADGTPVELAWQRQASRVICVVTDCNSNPPVLGAADQDAESGRGLQVVQALAATWGWMLLGETSKAVWAALTTQ